MVHRMPFVLLLVLNCIILKAPKDNPIPSFQFASSQLEPRQSYLVSSNQDAYTAPPVEPEYVGMPDCLRLLTFTLLSGGRRDTLGFLGLIGVLS